MGQARHLPAVLAALLAAAPLAAQPADSLAADAVPGTNRLFLLPTGRTLPAGTAEVGSYQIAAPYIGYALHDRVMIAAGTPLLPGAFGRFWYIAPKVGLLAERRWSAAAGGIILLDMGTGPFAGGEPLQAQSVGWGVVTWGDEAGSVTLGAATDMGGPWGVPESWLIFPGAELRLLGDDRGEDPTVVRVIYEAYLGLFVDRVLDGVHLVGLRIRGGRVAAEAVLPIIVRRSGIRPATIALFHVSVLL